MKNRLSFVLLLGLLLCGTYIASGADEQKVAFVSMETLFKEYHKTKTANEQLKAQFEPIDSRRKELLDEIKNLRGELDELSAGIDDKSISEEEREKKRAAAREAIGRLKKADAALAEFDGTTRKDFTEQMKQSQQKLIEEIRSEIADYAKKNGIHIVLDNSGKTLNDVESVIYYAPELDITKPILAILNKDADVAAPEKSPAVPPAEKK